MQATAAVVVVVCVFVLQCCSAEDADAVEAVEWKGSVNAAALLEVQTTIQLDLLLTETQQEAMPSFTGMQQQQQQRQLSSIDSVKQTLLQETLSQCQWVLQVHELLFTTGVSSAPAMAQNEPSITQLQADVLTLEWKENVATLSAAAAAAAAADTKLSEHIDSHMLLSSWMGVTTSRLLFPLEQQQEVSMTQQQQQQQQQQPPPKRTRTLLVKLLERNTEHKEEHFRFLTQQLVSIPRIKPQQQQQQQQQDDDLSSSWWRPYTRVEMQARSVVNLPSAMLVQQQQQQQQQSAASISNTNNLRSGPHNHRRHSHSSNYTTTIFLQEQESFEKTDGSSRYGKRSIAFGIVVVILVMSVRPSSSKDDNNGDDDLIDHAADFVQEDMAQRHIHRQEEEWEDIPNDDESSKNNDDDEDIVDYDDDEEEEFLKSNDDTAHWGVAVVPVQEGHTKEPNRTSSTHDEGSNQGRGNDHDSEDQPGFENNWQFEQESTAQWGDAILNGTEDCIEERLQQSQQNDRAHWGEGVFDVDEGNTHEPRQGVVDSEKHVKHDDDPKEQIDVPRAMEKSGQGKTGHDDEAVRAQETFAVESHRRPARNNNDEEQLKDDDSEVQIDMPPPVERCKICPEGEFSFVEALEKSCSEYQAMLAEKRREAKNEQGEITEGHAFQKQIDVGDNKKIVSFQRNEPRRQDERTTNGGFVYSSGSIAIPSANAEAALSDVSEATGEPNVSTLIRVTCETLPEQALGTVGSEKLSGAEAKNDAECVDRSELARDPLQQDIDDRPTMEVWEIVSSDDHAKVTSISSSRDENNPSTDEKELSDVSQAGVSNASHVPTIEVNDNSHIPNAAGTDKSDGAGSTKLLECSAAGATRDQAKTNEGVEMEESRDHQMARERGFKRSREVFENAAESSTFPRKSVVVSTDWSHCSRQTVLIGEVAGVGGTKEPPGNDSSDLHYAHSSSKCKEQLPPGEKAECQTPDSSYTSSLASDSASSEERLRRERHNRIPSNELLQSVMARFDSAHGADRVSAAASAPSNGLPKSETALSKENVAAMPSCGVKENMLNAIDCEVGSCDGASEQLPNSKNASLDPFHDRSQSSEVTISASKEVADGDPDKFEAEQNVLGDAPKDISAHAAAEDDAGDDDVATEDEVGKVVMLEDTQNGGSTNTAAYEDLDARMAAQSEVEDAEVVIETPEDTGTKVVAGGDMGAVATFENKVEIIEVPEEAPKDFSTTESDVGEDSGEDTTTVNAAEIATMLEGAQRVISTGAAIDDGIGTRIAVDDVVDGIEGSEDAQKDISTHVAPFGSGVAGAAPDEGISHDFIGAHGEIGMLYEPSDIQSEEPTHAPADVLPDIVLSKSLLNAAETIQSDIWEFGEGTQLNPFNLTSTTTGLRSAALRRARRSVSRSRAFELSSTPSMPEPMRVTRSRTKRENEDGTKSGTRSSRRNPAIPEKEILGVMVRVDPNARLPRRNDTRSEVTTGAQVKNNVQTSHTLKETQTRTKAVESREADLVAEKTRVLPSETAIAIQREEQETTKSPIEVTSSLSKSLQIAAEMMEAPTWSLASESRRPPKATFGKTTVRRAERVMTKNKSASTKTTPALTRKPLSPSRTNVLRSSQREVNKKNVFSTRRVVRYTPTTAAVTAGSTTGHNTKKDKKRPLRVPAHDETIDLTFSPDQGDASALPSLQQNRPNKRIRRLTSSTFKQTSKK